MIDAAERQDSLRGAGQVPGLRLHLLHNPRLTRPDGNELALPDKDAALLALVVLDAPAARAHVATLLWPGVDGAEPAAAGRKAHNNLRQRLFRLARWAGQDVVTQGRMLALAPGVGHDVAVPTELLLQDPQAAPGELLGGHIFDDGTELGLWVDAARQRWRAARADALIGLVVRLETEGRLGQALQLAMRLVADEPVMEHASRLLMRLHHRRGDRGAALAEFERCRRSLYERLGDVPSDETIELSLAISRADAPAPTHGGALPLALRHPPRTVGREEASARAEHRWQQLGVVLLLGAAGIGKTRLLGDLARRWDVTVEVPCRPESAALSLGLLSQLARALWPLLRERAGADLAAWLQWLAAPFAGPSPAQPVQPAKLVQVLAAALAAANQQGLVALAIEDLHYADNASLEVLRELLGDGASVRWLLSSRDADLPAPLQAWLDDQPPGRDPAVRLAPLDGAATRDFMLSLGVAQGSLEPAARRLQEHCGGHPLFMLQVLRQLQLGGQFDPAAWPQRLPLPDDAMVSATQRLARADGVAQQMAFLAALCGADFSPTLLCRLMNLSAAQLLVPWRRLEDLHIFGPLGFAHDLVREAVLSVVPPALAPLLHREIGQALAQAGTDPLRCALHWEAAGDAAFAARDYAAAAAAAKSSGLMVAGIELLRRAARQYRLAGQAEQGFASDWQAAHLMIGNSSVQEALDLAEMLAAEAASALEKVLARELMARVKIERQDAGAIDDARQALAAARQLGDAALAARCRMRMGEARSQLGEPELALADLEAVQAQAELLDDDLRHDLEGDLTSVLASLGRREEAVHKQREILAQALAGRDLARAAFAAGFCATHLSYLGRVSEGVSMAEQSVALAQQVGIERGLTLVDEMGLAGNLGDLGRFDEALTLGERVIAQLEASSLSAWAINAGNDRAVIFLRLGRVDLAMHILNQPINDAPVWVRAARNLVKARIEQWQGRPARDLVAQAVAMFEQGGVSLDDYPRHKIVLELARATSPEDALASAAQTIAWAAAHQHLALERYARMVQVQALHACGRIEQAAAQAQALADTPGIAREAYGYYLPQFLQVLCEALRAARRHEAGDRLARQAVAWIETCAAHHVPAVFVDSFRQRNPVNAQLLSSR